MYKASNTPFRRKDGKGAHLVHHFVEPQRPWFRKVNQVIVKEQLITNTNKDIERLLHFFIIFYYFFL